MALGAVLSESLEQAAPKQQTELRLHPYQEGQKLVLERSKRGGLRAADRCCVDDLTQILCTLGQPASQGIFSSLKDVLDLPTSGSVTRRTGGGGGGMAWTKEEPRGGDSEGDQTRDWS